MSTETTTNAVAKQDNGPAALVRRYREDFTGVLPEHIKGDAFIRMATGALRTNKALAQAAERNPGSFMSALLDCARLGHEPGSNAYYFVPFGGEVQGIESYRGIVERIYRAGAVSSVKCEVVCENDTFRYQPGMERPEHEVDWFEDRGKIKGAYSYAIMRDGSTSRVVVINRAYIDKVKKESKGSDNAKSPWVKWEESMVLKTVAKRLESWVPSSASYLREQLKQVQQAQQEAGAGTGVDWAQQARGGAERMRQHQGPGRAIQDVSDLTEAGGGVGDVIDGEVVDDYDPAEDHASLFADESGEQ